MHQQSLSIAVIGHFDSLVCIGSGDWQCYHSKEESFITKPTNTNQIVDDATVNDERADSISYYSNFNPSHQMHLVVYDTHILLIKS